MRNSIYVIWNIHICEDIPEYLEPWLSQKSVSLSERKIYRNTSWRNWRKGDITEEYTKKVESKGECWRKRRLGKKQKR